MTTLAALASFIAQGEPETLDFGCSTVEQKRVCETLCPFLNGEDGKVLIGVDPDGRLVGQEVADITLRDNAAMIGRFEPPACVKMSRVAVSNGSRREIVSMLYYPEPPYVFRGHAYHPRDNRPGGAT